MKVSARDIVIGVLLGIVIFTIPAIVELKRQARSERLKHDREVNGYIEELYKRDGQVERGELLPIRDIYDCYPDGTGDTCIVDVSGLFDY